MSGDRYWESIVHKGDGRWWQCKVTPNPSPVELIENTQTLCTFGHGVLGLVILVKHKPHGKHGKKRAEQCIKNQILKITATLPVLCLLVDCAIQRMHHIHTLATLWICNSFWRNCIRWTCLMGTGLGTMQIIVVYWILKKLNCILLQAHPGWYKPG